MRKYEILVLSEKEAKLFTYDRDVWLATNVFIEGEDGHLRPYKERWKTYNSAVIPVFLPQNPSQWLDIGRVDDKIRE